MKFKIRRECLHYWLKENREISERKAAFYIWYRQDILRHFEIPYLEMFITTKCDLHCKHCSNLIPAMDGQIHYEISDLTGWLDELLSKIDCLYRLKIHGGEVFLYPRLREWIEYVDRQSKIKSIRLTTNGTIIPADDVLQAIANNKIAVQISDYQLPNIKTQQLIEKLKKFGVHHIYLKDQIWKDMGEVSQRGCNRFEDCNMKRCTSLYEGKIYVCSRAAIMAKMGKIPDEGIPLTLPEKKLKTELKKLYSGKYSEACTYCDGDTQYAKEIVAGEQE